MGIIDITMAANTLSRTNGQRETSNEIYRVVETIENEKIKINTHFERKEDAQHYARWLHQLGKDVRIIRKPTNN
jgi:hypothetical protein